MLKASVIAACCALLFAPVVIAQERLIANEPTATKPLEKGQKVPEVTLRGLDGTDVSLASLHQNKPLIIVFFRGGWCPICTKHTQQLIKIYPELTENGFELIGVSPDSVASTKANIDKSSIPFPLYSDSEMNSADRHCSDANYVNLVRLSVGGRCCV
jgi:peroxiredoxin